jgi:glyoxylase-like metal-dependent hydrolase (beta-lactamase superfamily II)
VQNSEFAPAALVSAALELDEPEDDAADVSSEPPQAVSRTTAAATDSPLRQAVRVRRMVRRLAAGGGERTNPAPALVGSRRALQEGLSGARRYGPGVDVPVDPRDRWGLPAPGAMPRTADLEPLVTRVLAPNPSGMTLDGTNTYLVGAPGGGQAVLVDPGPDDPRHLTAVEQALAGRGARCVAVLVTHHHGDHAEAALPWGAHFDARVAAATPAVAGPAGRVLEPGERLSLAGTTIGVVPTPGHTADHLAFRLESGAVLVGDHVLGRGTSVVTHPDGNVVAYLESLRRIHDLGPSALYCGHGPELTEDPGSVLDFYLAHRAYREQQLLEALAGGARTVEDLVSTVYAEAPPGLRPAAAQSTRATLAKLVAEGRAVTDGDGVRPA